MDDNIIKEIDVYRLEGNAMFQTIQKIVAILSGYENGKLLEKKKGKTRKKIKVKDVVSISEEARKRINANGNESNLPHTEETLYVIKRSGD